MGLRGSPRREHQRPLFFDGDIRRPQEQRIRVPRADTGSRFHAARYNEHSGGAEGSAGGSIAPAVVIMHDVGHRLKLCNGEGRLLGQREPRALREDKMNFILRMLSELPQAFHGKRRAACTGDADKNGCFLHGGHSPPSHGRGQAPKRRRAGISLFGEGHGAVKNGFAGDAVVADGGRNGRVVEGSSGWQRTPGMVMMSASPESGCSWPTERRSCQSSPRPHPRERHASAR